MEVEKSSRRSCFTQTSCLGEDLGEDSQLEYLSAYEEYEEEKNNWSELSEQGEVGEVKDVPLAADKVPPQISAGEGESGKREKPTPSVAVEPDIPSLPPREKAQPCKHAEPSCFSSCEKPAEEAETQLPVPEIPSSKNPIAGRGDAAKSSGESPSAVKWQRGKALRSVPGVSATVQAGEAGSDGRAGFLASRSSSAQVCLCSRAVNTEITLMNKTRPWGRLTQIFVDAASIAEWSFKAQSSHVQESGDYLSICVWKTGTNRPEHPNKPTGQSSASGCCPDVLQRAVEAELQLLAAHYEMCSKHCLKAFKLALKENTYFGRCEQKTELYLALWMALDELDNNYRNMRMKISKGIPLSELPPLSVELTFSSVSSFYIPSKLLRKSLYSDDLSGEGKTDSEEPKQQEKKISDNMDKLQAAGDQPGDSASPEKWEEQPKDQAPERGCVKNEEGSEYWFDAKEDLSVADISVICRETKRQQGKQDSIDSREVKTVGSENEHSSVHADGPKASVPEDPGENSLQKTSTRSSVYSTGIFVSPYALNLSSYTKLIKRLQGRHPQLSKEEIARAIREVRRLNNGVLSGLSISCIEERTSAILSSISSSQQGKQ